jgi:hypothetical protein
MRNDKMSGRRSYWLHARAIHRRLGQSLLIAGELLIIFAGDGGLHKRDPDGQRGYGARFLVA